MRAWLRQVSFDLIIASVSRLTNKGTRTVHISRRPASTRILLTVKPRGKRPSSSVLPKLTRIKLSRHSAQKSNLYRKLYSSIKFEAYSFCPSSCFCSSVNLYLVCVTSNLPWPCRVTRQTRRLVPPRSSARYSPFSSPVGHYGY